MYFKVVVSKPYDGNKQNFKIVAGEEILATATVWPIFFYGTFNLHISTHLFRDDYPQRDYIKYLKLHIKAYYKNQLDQMVGRDLKGQWENI